MEGEGLILMHHKFKCRILGWKSSILIHFNSFQTSKHQFQSIFIQESHIFRALDMGKVNCWKIADFKVPAMLVIPGIK